MAVAGHMTVSTWGKKKHAFGSVNFYYMTRVLAHVLPTGKYAALWAPLPEDSAMLGTPWGSTSSHSFSYKSSHTAVSQQVIITISVEQHHYQNQKSCLQHSTQRHLRRVVSEEPTWAPTHPPEKRQDRSVLSKN